jgi:Zn-dependent protease with chaperone function
MVAMAGSAVSVTSANQKMFAELLKKYQSVSDDEVTRFCNAGQLLFSDKRKTTVLKGEEKSMFGSFFSGTRKVASGGLGFASKLASTVVPDNKLVSAASEMGSAVSGLIYSEVGPVQEYQVGSVVASRVLPLYHPLDPDHPASRYVRYVGGLLCAASNDPMPYGGTIFCVMKSDEINAFAVPGGFIFITTGMLKFLRDEDELAAILGHEMGHLELRHGMRAVGTENVLKLFSLATKVGASAASTEGASALAQQQLKQLADSLFDKMTDSIRNGYGIEMESEADWRSLQFSVALGYDNKALYDVLERFKAEKGSYGGASYPTERGSDVLRYREGLSCSDAPAKNRTMRATRYRAAVNGL